MREEVKDKWVEALRSGKYEQGIGYLHDLTNDKFCCLGVLCDVAVREGLQVKVGSLPVQFAGISDEPMRVSTFDLASGVLPESVREWADLKGTDPDFYPHYDDESPDTCASLNDGGYSFEEIAERIENNWEEL